MSLSNNSPLSFYNFEAQEMQVLFRNLAKNESLNVKTLLTDFKLNEKKKKDENKKKKKKSSKADKIREQNAVKSHKKKSF